MTASKQLKRILLKLSGEQFAGEREYGIDPAFTIELAKELKDLVESTGAEVAIVVGGGNIMRGASVAAKGLERSTGDYMGMLATIMNGMALVDALESSGQPARLQSRLRCDSVAEPFIRRRATRHLGKNRVLIVAGGLGNPYMTTDTGSVITALELDCEMVLKATKVDGVYDKDPNKHAGATKFNKLKHADALQNGEINVMDNAAISLAMENQLPIVVFDLLTKGNIKRIVEGQSVGTLIT